ncbi:hypothetical protein SASPL_124286 [Salvia splendens]|uniref:Uncharacterized protein n=1 Tax=Salvia splendens TaxID=180675 RepID=A0A8X8XMZ0_SALSN|nr:hypothetical protein SASPL_124286 [Salvia splendens]
MCVAVAAFRAWRWSRPWKEYGLERVVVAGLPDLDDDSATEEMLEQRVQCGETWVVTAGQRRDRLTLTPQLWRWDLAGMDCGAQCRGRGDPAWGANVDLEFSMPVGEEDKLLFGDLGDLPEYSMAFRRHRPCCAGTE